MEKLSKLAVFLCGTMAISLAACQTDELSDNPTSENTQKVYHVTVSADAAQGTRASTRALAVDPANGKRLISEWAMNDGLAAFVNGDEGKQNNYFVLTTDRGGKSAKFTGDIAAAGRSMSTSDNISFLYPAVALKGANKTITPVERKEESITVGTASKIISYVPSAKIQKFVSLNLSRQDGTAASLGSRFDYQCKTARPQKVEDDKLDIKIGKLQRLVSFWGLRFTDENNNKLSNIDSIYVSNIKASGILNITNNTFASDDNYEASRSIAVIPANGTKFTSANNQYTYIALLPGNYTNVHIMVYSKGKMYEQEYANINLTADNVYHTDILHMTPVGPKPWVEVQGVKWATGNFIHYGPERGGYWGIAPAQWWISQRAVTLGRNRKVTNYNNGTSTSQFADFPTQKIEDVDLFRYGHIKEALKLKDNQVFKYSVAGKKLYYPSSPGSYTDWDINGTGATRGDIAWYYTKDKHQHYRMPTGDEMKKLYKEARAIPAYCYTDKGTKVYGAYFTTSTSGGYHEFPAKRFVKSIDSYTNVTALIQANKGLFLPYTGLRDPGSDGMKMRDLSNDGNAYGQYMTTDESQWKDRSADFFFGAAEWNWAEHPKTQAKAIRPVWDSGDNTLDTDYLNLRNSLGIK
jgi:putative lipoprotein